MMSSCMINFKFLPKPYMIHLELGKPLHIHAACFTLSLVNLWSIPYESLVMLLKLRSLMHSTDICVTPTLGCQHSHFHFHPDPP